MTATEGSIFGMGNPLLDMVTTVDKAFLDKYDLKSNDAILAEEKHMPIYEEIANGSVEYLPGGATLNAIKIAQILLKAPKSASFTGCIKDDKYGKILEENCRSLGVDPAMQHNKGDQGTGTCAVLVHGEDRSLVTSLGAANCFTVDHLDNEHVWAKVQRSKICYIAGFFLTVCPKAIQKVAEQALASGTCFTMNLSAPFLLQFFNEPLMAAMPYIDVLFGNESEAEAFAKAQSWEETSVADIALKVAKMPLAKGKQSRTVVFTQGAAPVIVVENGELTEYPVESLPAEKIVDTNGAGDAFVGGFLAQRVLGKATKEAVACGIAAARIVIQRSGCTFPQDHGLM